MSSDEFPFSFYPHVPLSHSSLQIFSTFFLLSFFSPSPPLFCLNLFSSYFLLSSCVSVFLWFPLSLPLCHLLFIKPVFYALLPSQQAPPQGSVYMVSYCAVPCAHTETCCICVFVCVCVCVRGVVIHTFTSTYRLSFFLLHTPYTVSRYCMSPFTLTVCRPSVR